MTFKQVICYYTDTQFRKTLREAHIPKSIWKSVWLNVKDDVYILDEYTLSLLKDYKPNYGNFDTVFLIENVDHPEMAHEVFVRRITRNTMDKFFKAYDHSNKHSKIIYAMLHNNLTIHNKIARGLLLPIEGRHILFNVIKDEDIFDKPEYVGAILADGLYVGTVGQWIMKKLVYGRTITSKRRFASDIEQYWGESIFTTELSK